MHKFCICVCVIVQDNGIFVSRPHMDMQMRVWLGFFVKVIQQAASIA